MLGIYVLIKMICYIIIKNMEYAECTFKEGCKLFDIADNHVMKIFTSPDRTDKNGYNYACCSTD